MSKEIEAFNKWWNKESTINYESQKEAWLACAEIKDKRIKELEAQNEKLRNACVMYLDAQDWLAKVSCDKELMKTLKEIKGE